jgi:AraC-like DNA-binding protein
MLFERPLVMQDLSVPPANEWSPHCQGWTVVRIIEGSGYCLHKKGASELNAGDGFMAPETTGFTVRASQLGMLRLQYFQIQPGLLSGLLTTAESRLLKSLANNSTYMFPFKASDLSGREFSRLAGQPRVETLVMRCALLQLWARGMANLFDAPPPHTPVVVRRGGTLLRGRFFQMMEELPEAEILKLSLAELARQLNCSERHLGRLFMQKFGKPFRSYQIDLRLQRARDLLLDPSIKIASIAHDSGYHHLSLFNATFKERFGMTPSEWRRDHLPRSTPPVQIQNGFYASPPPC